MCAEDCAHICLKELLRDGVFAGAIGTQCILKRDSGDRCRTTAIISAAYVECDSECVRTALMSAQRQIWVARWYCDKRLRRSNASVFRPRSEHGSLAVRRREWTRNCAISRRRSAFQIPHKLLKYAARPQTGQNPPTPFIPRDFRPSFGAGKRATFCSSGG